METDRELPRELTGLTIEVFSKKLSRPVSETKAINILEESLPLTELTIDLWEEEQARRKPRHSDDEAGAGATK